MTANPLGPNPFKSLVDPSLTVPELGSGEGFEGAGLGDLRQLGYDLLWSPVFTDIMELNAETYKDRVRDMDEDLRSDFVDTVNILNAALRPTSRLESPSLAVNEQPIYAWYFLVNLPPISEDKMRPIGFTEIPTQVPTHDSGSVPLNP